MNKNFNPYDDPMFGGDPDKAKVEAEARAKAEAEARAKAEAAKAKADEGKAGKRAGWSMDAGPPSKWTLDLSNDGKDLPPPGLYEGFINVRLHDKVDVLWLTTEHEIPGHEATPPMAVIKPLAAAPESEHYNRVHEGKSQLWLLCEATGVDMSSLNIENLPGKLSGRGVKFTVAHKKVNGVTRLIVRRYDKM